MTPTHCHLCGGVIPKGAKVDYLPPSGIAQIADPNDDPCECAPPIVYQEPPLIDHPE
jgi:hypothetical protein